MHGLVMMTRHGHPSVEIDALYDRLKRLKDMAR
jgi:hypothetical protein